MSKNHLHYFYIYIYIHILALLDEKLGEMEEFYSSKRDENFRIGATAMEERLMSFQRQLEERYRTDLKLEVGLTLIHYKSSTIAIAPTL